MILSHDMSYTLKKIRFSQIVAYSIPSQLLFSLVAVLFHKCQAKTMKSLVGFWQNWLRLAPTFCYCNAVNITYSISLDWSSNLWSVNTVWLLLTHVHMTWRSILTRFCFRPSCLSFVFARLIPSRNIVYHGLYTFMNLVTYIGFCCLAVKRGKLLLTFLWSSILTISAFCQYIVIDTNHHLTWIYSVFILNLFPSKNPLYKSYWIIILFHFF